MSQWNVVNSFTRPLRIVVVAIAMGLALTSCATHDNGSAGTTATTAATSSTTTIAPTTTTTTVPLPGAPQPSAEIAASDLMASWASGNRAEALTVATPAAVDTLFAAKYTPGLAIDRGCNSNTPTLCAYGPPGGSPPTDPLYQLYVLSMPGGWYVNSVQIDN